MSDTGNIDAPPAYAKRWYPIVPTGGSRYSKTSLYVFPTATHRDPHPVFLVHTCITSPFCQCHWRLGMPRFPFQVFRIHSNPLQRTPPDDLQWAPLVHPEGQPYSTRVLPKFRVVVDFNVHEPSKEFTDFWVKRMDDFVHMQDIQLPAGALELYLEPHELDPHQSCSYYFISHSTRKVFWLEEVSSETLGMAPVVSDTHFGTYIHPFLPVIAY